jgi:hypothetical protein
MNVLCVGGKFDENGGRASKVANTIFSSCVNELVSYCHAKVDHLTTYNGGSLQDLEQASFRAQGKNTGLVLWFADVDNEVSKAYVRNIKKVNQTCILVAAKSSVGRDYTFADLIQKMLALKANLFVEFSKDEGNYYSARLLDPLGNQWSPGNENMVYVGECIARRVDELSRLTRMRSESDYRLDDFEVPDEAEFFEFVRKSALTFAKLIPSPTEIKRFVGNASFRCTKGFPSFRGDGVIWVSVRNVDKECIDRKQFMPVQYGADTLAYGSSGTNNKPSVDAPMQCRLYEMFPNIKYMIHGHVYLVGADMTSKALPCGVIEEADAIFHRVHDIGTTLFALNLRGHGFIAGASSVEQLNRIIAPIYEARTFPENQYL